MQELNNQIITYEDEGDEISILDILLIIAEGKKIILSFLFLFLLLGCRTEFLFKNQNMSVDFK